MAKLKIGDIIEIPTSKGYFYAQYTHKHPESGYLIQVANKAFDTRPEDLSVITELDVGIVTFLFLKEAIKENTFSVIDNLPIPRKRLKFPVFRSRGGVSKDGVVKQWCFWDGENYWPDYWIKKLTDDQKKYPYEEYGMIKCY